jgi:hypothetical protein
MAVTNSNDATGKHRLRGTLIMIAGAALLLNTLGLIQKSFTFVLIVAACALIVYGCYISGVYNFISRQLFHKS